MDNVAIAFGENIIGWEYVVDCCGVVAGFFISLWIYYLRKAKIFPMIFFQVVAGLFSLLVCRIVYWYCHMELYSELFELWTDTDMGHFFMFGMVFAAWMTAFGMEISQIVKNRYEILDAASPGMAFSMALFRFSGMFSGACLGKYNISNKIFMRLPFAYSTDGRYWKAAPFCISFLWLFTVSACLFAISFRSQKKHSRKKSGKPAEGAIFRLFIILFSLSEILIDSMRYDASHLFFPGRMLADLNKGAGFMGLSQLLGAIICLVLMISYTVKTEKKPAKNEKRIKPVVKLVIFVAGTTIGGSFEYFVQRNSSRWVVLYLVMICGIAIMMFSLVSAWREAE